MAPKYATTVPQMSDGVLELAIRNAVADKLRAGEMFSSADIVNAVNKVGTYPYQAVATVLRSLATEWMERQTRFHAGNGTTVPISREYAFTVRHDAPFPAPNGVIVYHPWDAEVAKYNFPQLTQPKRESKDGVSKAVQYNGKTLYQQGRNFISLEVTVLIADVKQIEAGVNALIEQEFKSVYGFHDLDQLMIHYNGAQFVYAIKATKFDSPNQFWTKFDNDVLKGKAVAAPPVRTTTKQTVDDAIATQAGGKAAGTTAVTVVAEVGINADGRVRVSGNIMSGLKKGQIVFIIPNNDRTGAKICVGPSPAGLEVLAESKPAKRKK